MKIKNLSKNSYKFNSIIDFKPNCVLDIAESEIECFPAIKILIERNEFEIVKEELKDISQKIEEVSAIAENIKPKRTRKSKKGAN